MRILVISDLFPPFFSGGYELQSELQVNELARRGHEVTVLTSTFGIAQPQRNGNVYRYLNVRQWPGQNASSFARRRYQLQWAASSRKNYRVAREVLDETQPEVVYAWNMNSINVQPLIAARDVQLPRVAFIADYWLADLKRALDLEPNAIKRAYHALLQGISSVQALGFAQLFICSETMLAHYRELGFEHDQMRVVYPGLSADLLVDSDALDTRFPRVDGCLSLLFVARLVPYKGLEVVLDALPQLLELAGFPRVTLDVVGDGDADYVTSLHRRVEDLGIAANVNFLGHVAFEDLVVLYRQHDILLFPSLWVEPFGMTIVDAMSQGLPVIASNHGGPAEIITPEENGLLVKPKDVQGWADAIRWLVDHPVQVSAMRVAAFETVRDKYTNELAVDKVEAYLLNMLEAG